MAGHLAVLEGVAGVLPLTGRADRAVRHRDAVGGAQAAEAIALHAAGKALADARAGDVDELADDEMVGRDLGADRDELVARHTEFRELELGLDLGDRKPAALGLGNVLHLGPANAELERP